MSLTNQLGSGEVLRDSGSFHFPLFHPGQASLLRLITSRSKRAAATLGIVLTSQRKRKAGGHQRPRAHGCRSLPLSNASLEGAAVTSSRASLAGTGHVTAPNCKGSRGGVNVCISASAVEEGKEGRRSWAWRSAPRRQCLPQQGLHSVGT